MRGNFAPPVQIGLKRYAHVVFYNAVQPNVSILIITNFIEKTKIVNITWQTFNLSIIVTDERYGKIKFITLGVKNRRTLSQYN